MDCNEAQNVALRLVNLKSDSVTLIEIKQALSALANYYEDTKAILRAKEIKNAI